MTELLVRFFIKDKDNVGAPEVRKRFGMLGGAVGILCNIILFGFKLAVGTAAGSVAIVADAFNNLSDAGSSIATLLGFKMAAKPPDQEHPFGHGRFEYITSLAIAGLIFVVGVTFFRTSFERVLNPGQVSYSTAAVIVLSVSMLVKFWLSLFNRKLGRKINAAPMLATAADSLSDVAVSGVTLLSVILSLFTAFPVDGCAGFVVSFFILYSGFKVARSTVDTLLGQPADPALVKAITSHILAAPGVNGVHDLVIHSYGPGRTMASAHVEVPYNSNLLKAHDTIDMIEREIQRELKIPLVIHMDPIDTDSELVNIMRLCMTDIVRSIEPSLGIHDFRIVSGDTHTNLIFDVSVPFRCELTNAKIRDEINRKLKEQIQENYYTVITFDRSFL